MATSSSVKVESTAKKALRYTGYVASFGITYIIRQIKKNKQQKAKFAVLRRQSSVESMRIDEDWINADNLMFNTENDNVAAWIAH